MSAVTAAHAAELLRGAAELGVELTASQQEQLLAYLALLIKWNQAYNLTAVRNPDEMVSRHLLDSLSIVPFVREAGRAFSSRADFAHWTRHLGDAETRWLAMKGLYPHEELAALPADFRVEAEHVLQVPGCQGQRHLLILRRCA